MTPESRALIVAIELLRKQIADLPMALLLNAGKTAEAIVAEKSAPEKARLDPGAFGVEEGFGGDHLPRTGSGDVAGKNPFWERMGDRFGRTLSVAEKAAGALAGRFALLMGPLGTLTTFLTSSTSGFQVATQALSLFAATVGPVVMPAFFLLSVALASLSEVVWRKLVPNLEGFYRTILSVGIPAIQSLADMAIKAADALKFVANSWVGRNLAGGESDRTGGYMGAANRSLDRFGFELGASERPKGDERKSWAQRAEGTADDVARTLPGGSSLVGAKNWVKERVGMEAETPTESGASPEAKEATGRGLRDTLKEYMMSMSPRASAGTPASVWTAAQTASLNLTPYQQRTLQIMQQMLQALNRAAADPAFGTHTEGESFITAGVRLALFGRRGG